MRCQNTLDTQQFDIEIAFLLKFAYPNAILNTHKWGES